MATKSRRDEYWKVSGATAEIRRAIERLRDVQGTEQAREGLNGILSGLEQLQDALDEETSESA